MIPFRLLSDERLARLTGEGNDPAFATLHRRYDPLLHGYTRSIARDADDAADALQNAWIAALVALRAERRSAPVRPWLFRIAHNAAIDVLRRKASVVRAIDRGTLTAVPGVDEQYARSQTMAEVVGDMRELPTNQRAALVMRELADLDYSEIAIALSTSEGNARQLVFAARDGLRETRAGRALPCESVRGVLAHADGRELRRRRLRAHLDSCQDCRAYAASVTRPARKVAGWAPTPAVLQSIFAAAGGSGAAITQGGSFAGLAKGAVAATLIVAGVGTGEAVVHYGGGEGGPATAQQAGGDVTGKAAGAIVAESKPAAPRAVPAEAIQAASRRATRTSPIALAANGPQPRARTSSNTTSQGSRRQPGASAPADRSPRPHAGDRTGADDAGPGGPGAVDPGAVDPIADRGPRQRDRDGSRAARGGGGGDCPPHGGGGADAPPAT